MKKIHSVFLFFMLLIPLSAAAQDDSAAYRQTASVPASENSRFTLDAIGNILVYEGSSIKKYDLSGSLLRTYSETRYGEIENVDAMQPMKIMIFFKNFSKVLLLDNTLTPITSVTDLSSKGLDQVSLAGFSRNSEFVFYDERNFEILRTDLSLNVLSSSGNLATILGITLKPDFLVCSDNFILLNNPSRGILVFDEYGTYLKTFPCKECSVLQVREGNLFSLQDGQLKTFGLKTGTVTESSLPIAFRGETRTFGKYFFVHDKNCIRIIKKD